MSRDPQPVFEVRSRITHRSLMNKSKTDLAHLVMDLMRQADAARDLREAIGEPFMTGHSGVEGGPFVRLRYLTVSEAMTAHDALHAVLRRPVERIREG